MIVEVDDGSGRVEGARLHLRSIRPTLRVWREGARRGAWREGSPGRIRAHGTHGVKGANGVMLYDDVVVLIPGFFGFGRLGDFFYFADRVQATLRGALEARLGRAIPVLSIASEPASSLAARQQALLTQLRRVDLLLEGPARYHLVGHSAGGVDADLLTMAQPLAAGLTWNDCDSHGIRARVRSITTISAPHYGTNLSNSTAVGFLRDPVHHARGAAEGVGLALSLGAVVAQRSLTLDALAGVAQSGSATRDFLLHLLLDQDLVTDLQTSRMEALRATSVRQLFPQTVTFATCVPSRPVALDGVPRSCDRFFARLHALTAREAPSSLATAAALRALESSSHLSIRNPSAHLGPFGVGSSDGVINTARQILVPASLDGSDRDAPDSDITLRDRAPREATSSDAGGRPAGARPDGWEPIFGGCVVADHADVIGHYDRRDPLSLDLHGQAKPINDGFFRSGAGFGDDQFFKLYERVADWVARAAQPGALATSRSPFLALVANQ